MQACHKLGQYPGSNFVLALIDTKGKVGFYCSPDATGLATAWKETCPALEHLQHSLTKRKHLSRHRYNSTLPARSRSRSYPSDRQRSTGKVLGRRIRFPH